jgi:cytidylate kinase
MTETLYPVITIDGPSGSGKGTIGIRLAQWLGWHYLDSGLLYRALACMALQYDIAPEDVESLVKHTAALTLDFKTEELRSEKISQLASKIAVLSPVRSALLIRQQAFRQAPGLIADGRDMGTRVFSDAQVKLYFEATASERALRRQAQLKAMGQDVILETLLQDIEARDTRDKARSVAPLKPAADAVIIDTTGLNIEGVLERAMYIVRNGIKLTNN